MQLLKHTREDVVETGDVSSKGPDARMKGAGVEGEMKKPFGTRDGAFTAPYARHALYPRIFVLFSSHTFTAKKLETKK